MWGSVAGLFCLHLSPLSLSQILGVNVGWSLWKMAEMITSATRLTHITLANGVVMPRLGLGTFRARDEDVRKAVLCALQCGYTHIDTASIYKNEVEIGETVRASGIERDKLFITSKVSPYEQGFEKATQAVNNILDRLGFSYLDLCLIHWPGAAKLDTKSNKNSKLRSETWRALEQFYKQGKCRAIGVSNYTEKHLDELISSCEIKPMVNQVEVHPWLAQPQLRTVCNQHGVVVQAYSPLGVGSLLRDSTVQTVASNCKRSPAQVLLRWGIQNDLVVLPKSVHEEYIVENQDIFSFSLSDEDMASLNSLDRGHHFCWSAEDVC
ncbi:hypothetical protein KC19_5G010000 [Ceratodon purpureus]|uniref:NADP-dependent oxidoreductase domain-containing protein n=1 Tax=Ceratodon purpureus TaxID=3225 RepID=A0A8T0HWS9_CERPU|nr:hypothetical protein KC19_5G010000 [Ceratodon purpureus]